MGRFVLGLQEFPRKKDAVSEVRRILYESAIGRPVGGYEAALLSAVLERHPAAAEKSAKGVRGFTVRKIEFRPGIVQRCFFIRHPDGSETDFSFMVALGLAPCGPTVAAAGRHAIAPAVHEFKQKQFNGADYAECAVTAERVGFREAHVDHAPPWQFSRIVTDFVHHHGIPPLHDEEGLRTVFSDQADSERFVAFHDARAVLRVVSAKANMSMGDRA